MPIRRTELMGLAALAFAAATSTAGAHNVVQRVRVTDSTGTPVAGRGVS
jgi:hypothetical protein